ncbi:glycosyltransferase family 2 protein [Candidatus Uhrbacteria bacterium]|nr:glycosyltransferase family 2 protein [Candidatus Uhrbacteria bacterium]MBI4592562.1 glycosyltransferase family 2 protein [Candidatus Uhrbacteria bacterium]
MSYHYGQSRFWEMFPGLLVWGTFSLALALSFLQPLWVIVFIIVFDLLWLFRVLYFNVFVVISWSRYRRARKTDWQKMLASVPGSERIRHLVLLPTYKESYEIIRSTLRSLRDNTMPNNRFFVVLGGEEADKEAFEKMAHRAQQEFGSVFAYFGTTLHPKGLPDEIPGKGSNLHWMGHELERRLRERFPEVKDEEMVVSAFDIDTVAHPQYFSYLTYLYCTVEDPTRSSYQPIAMFSNNIWSANAPVRIGAFGTTFWLFGELTRSERLWTFSSHSMPWKMLKDVGFWQKDIVSEDSRIFMQAYLHYHGDYRVTPMFLPVSMDAVTGANYLDSMKALYVQMRRWAWGVEHLPFIIDGFKHDSQIPWRKKAQYVFNHIEGMFTWATAPIIMFVLGWLPLWVAKGQTNALIQAAPFTLEQLMQFAMIGILISAVMSLTLLPSRPQEVRRHTWITMGLQWILLPVTFILFGSFPAIDAQTRLMIGNYLGFKVTKKTR